MQRRVSVAVVNDYEMVVHGLAMLLAPHADRIAVRDRYVIGESVDHGPIDVALFDTYGRVGIAERALRTLTEDDQIRHVALFSLDFPRPVVDDARRLGVRAFISKSLAGPAIADAVVRAAGGGEVDETGVPRRPAASERAWPGRDDGLTERESQVLVLCAEGLGNREIGEALYVSVDTVKTHLRQVYRKLGFSNRAQATRFVIESGAFARYQPTARLSEGHGTVDEPPVDGPTG